MIEGKLLNYQTILIEPAYQHIIISSYIDLGQPGGDGRRYPESTNRIH